MFRVENATVSDISQIGYYVPMEDNLTMGILALISIGLMLLFVWGVFVLGKRLDRYRLKYGFDRELEIKDIDNRKETTKQNRLDKREKAFNKRVFKD